MLALGILRVYENHTCRILKLAYFGKFDKRQEIVVIFFRPIHSLKRGPGDNEVQCSQSLRIFQPVFLAEAYHFPSSFIIHSSRVSVYI